MPALRGKPAMELYRPPTAMRSPGFAAACPPVNGYGHPHAGVLSAGPAGPGGPLGGGAGSPVRTNSGTALNINAKEFQPGLLDDTCNNNNNNNNNNARAPGAAGSPAKQPPALMRSKSSKDARSLKGKADIPANLMRSRSSKDGKLFQKVTFRSGGGGDAPAPSDDATNYDEKRPARGAPPAAAAGSGGAGVVMPPPPPLPGLQRSKSMVCGTADMVRGGGVGQQHQLQECSAPIATGAGAELGHFSPDVQLLIAIAVEDPNRLSGRHMMELVRHVFTRLVEAARYGEPAARLCIAVIERERTETFLETLLNTCQEWYQQRDRLLRPHQSTFGNGFVPASPRWIAYITFLNELFALLKRRQMSRPRMAGTATQMLLELLAECCLVTLRAPSVNSLAETECVFLILTSIGRDLEQDAAPQLERIMAAVRDALINCSLIGTVSKTLLQLVELQAARWQLPAPTVMYYYPMTAK